MNIETLNEIKSKNKGTQTVEDSIKETHRMYNNSRDNLNEVIEIMELLQISISDAETVKKLIKHGISETRALKTVGIKKADHSIVLKYVKYASTTEWNEFCLKELGEL